MYHSTLDVSTWYLGYMKMNPAIESVRLHLKKQHGRAEIFTPVYFSSVFLLDLQTFEIASQYDGSDMLERYSEKMWLWLQWTL